MADLAVIGPNNVFCVYVEKNGRSVRSVWKRTCATSQLFLIYSCQLSSKSKYAFPTWCHHIYISTNWPLQFLYYTRLFSTFSLQLDSQSRETERLQRQLYDDAIGGYHPPMPVRSALSDLDIPITSHMSTCRVGSFPDFRSAPTDFLPT